MTPKRRYSAPPPPPPKEGTVRGIITIVQEDRFRVMDGEGRGYLFTARKRAASMEDLERWCAEGREVTVRFDGVPDIGAYADRVVPGTVQSRPGG